MLLYFNAQPKNGVLYRHLNKAACIEVFNEVLERIMTHKPERIILACNTLEVLYPYTSISKSIHIPIVSIIDEGVRMMIDYLKKYENNTIIILGTRITIKSNLHKEKLMAAGVLEKDIINQACWNLSDMIQKGQKAKIKEMVQVYLEEAKQQLKGNPTNIVLALSCTHFQFIQTVFQQVAEEIFDAKVTILNPNKALSASTVMLYNDKTKDSMEIINQCFSNTKMSAEEVATISTAIEKEAPDVCQALRNYQFL